VLPDHPRSSIDGPRMPRKFRVNRLSIWLTALRDMSIFHSRCLGLKSPIPAILGTCFGGSPINIVRYCRDPKRHISGQKYTFWRIGQNHQDQSRNAACMSVEESKIKKKEKNSCDKSSACPDYSM